MCMCLQSFSIRAINNLDVKILHVRPSQWKSFPSSNLVHKDRYQPLQMLDHLFLILQSFGFFVYYVLDYVKQKDQTNSFSIVQSQIDQFQESNLWGHANLRF
jgi:hypothetical protein